MNYRYILLILFVLQLTLVYADCVGYTDNFDVRVLDAKNRPIDGAIVQVKFDRGTSFGEKYFTTQPTMTSSNGSVHYGVFNQGTNTRAIDCNIVISANISGSTKSVTVVANEHSNIVDLQLVDVYPTRFYVRDQYKHGIENAQVHVDTWGPDRTDTNGVVRGFLKKGSHEYFASYLDAGRGGAFEVNDDTDFEVIFPYYEITIDAADDSGAKVNAMLRIFNQTVTMENGHYEYQKVFGEQVPYEVEYSGIVNSGVITPATESTVTLYFDNHAPTISEVKSETEGNRPKLKITVTDIGIHASGLDIPSMKVWYKIEPSDLSEAWHPAVVFTSARNTFTAEFPEMAPNTIIKFRIEVKDRTGNKAQTEGKFTTLVVQNPQNTTKNDTDTPPNPPPSQGIPLIYIVVGIIVVVLAIYLVIRIKSKATSGGP